MIETLEAMIAAWDNEHVGVRLSPASTLYGIRDSDKRVTFGHVIDALDALKPAYLCLLDPNEKDAKTEQIKNVLATFRDRVSVPLIGNTGFDKAKGNAAIGAGGADAIAFGVPFLANPDLPERLRRDAPLNMPDKDKFYGEGPKGYTDYPLPREAQRLRRFAMVPHFTPDAVALLLIDYQVGTLQLATTNPADVAPRDAITLAKAALSFKMPIVVTASQEDRIHGRIDERLQHVIPDAFETRMKRQGIVDAWKEPNFRGAVE
jgi:hypothetical protein